MPQHFLFTISPQLDAIHLQNVRFFAFYCEGKQEVLLRCLSKECQNLHSKVILNYNLPSKSTKTALISKSNTSGKTTDLTFAAV